MEFEVAVNSKIYNMKVIDNSVIFVQADNPITQMPILPPRKSGYNKRDDKFQPLLLSNDYIVESDHASFVGDYKTYRFEYTHSMRIIVGGPKVISPYPLLEIKNKQDIIDFIFSGFN